MFAKLFTIASLAILAVATPTPGDGSAGNSCTTGPVQCCESIQKASDPAASKVLAAIGVVIQDIDALVGLTCSPISVVGVGSGNACNQQTVCCDDNSLGSLISIGCAPISL